MRILVTGASGMVGNYVKSVFDDAECILTDIDCLDIRDRKSVFNVIEQVKPDVVLHLAAATDVDKCELEPKWAFKANVTGTENITLACKQYNAVLVYLSSGAVFEGAKPQAYTELDKPGPVNVYAKTKLEGERVISVNLERYFIVRAGWMIGGGRKDLKFVGKIAQRMSRADTIKAVDDKFGSLTYAKDLLGGIRNLLRTEKFGLYHMVNPGMVSRYDIAVEMKSILPFKNVEILPVSSDQFPLPAPRGRSEALENLRLKQLKFDYMPNWKDALKEYLLKDYDVILNQNLSKKWEK